MTKVYPQPQVEESTDGGLMGKLVDIQLENQAILVELLTETKSMHRTLRNARDLMSSEAAEDIDELSSAEILDKGMRIAAMDTKRFSQEIPEDQRPPQPEVPAWAFELEANLNRIKEKGDLSNAALADLLSGFLTLEGYKPLQTGYIYKLCNIERNFFTWQDNRWMNNFSMNRPRFRAIVELAERYSR